VNQISGTTPAATPSEASDRRQPGAAESAGGSSEAPGFGARGRVRRRARFLRKARELAYRDLGGLVFNLHRFGQRNDELVLNKLNTLAHIDAELRTLETALRERDTVTVLREAGITACARCAAIHSGDDRFCPNCGLSMSRHVDLPIAGAPGVPSAPPTPGAPPASAPTTVHTPPAPATQPVTASWPAPPTVETTLQGEVHAGPGSAQAPPSPPSPGSTPAPGVDTADGGPHAAPAPATGRSPIPPTGRSPNPPPREAPGTGSGEEQTEIIHSPEPEK
jgi:hypothetical protein